MLSTPRCVHCRKRAVDEQFRPFCSERCKMADLGRWLNGTYVVAGRTASPTDQLLGDVPDDGTDEARWRR